MEKKDLSLVYALKEYARVNGKGGPIIEYNRCFTLDDIKAAFNAGRDSVVENIPELKWDQKNVEYFFASTPFGTYYTDSLNAELLFYNGQRIARYFGNVETHFSFAKRVANKDYKKRIKQALGL